MYKLSIGLIMQTKYFKREFLVSQWQIIAMHLSLMQEEIIKKSRKNFLKWKSNLIPNTEFLF